VGLRPGRAPGGYAGYAAVAAGAFVVGTMAVVTIVGMAGDGNAAERIDFSDFEGGLLQPGEIDNRSFFATCPPGKLIVEFTPADEVRITRDDGPLIVSLNEEDASVTCPGVLEERRGWGFYVRGLRRTGSRSVKLECVVQQPLDLVAHPIFQHETQVHGGSVVIGTPVPHKYPRAVIIASFTEERSDLHFRPGPCRIAGS
jgi:hypothetical protein